MSLLEHIQEAHPDNPTPIRSFAAKGIIHLDFTSFPSLYLFDIKTPGYPLKKFVHAYLVKGGNWGKAEEQTPLDTYRKELQEEIVSIEAKYLTEAAATREQQAMAWFHETLLANTKPYKDFIYLAKEAHHSQKGKGSLAGVTSWFVSSLSGTELCHRLGIHFDYNVESISSLSYHLNIRSKESQIGIISEDNFATGVHGIFPMSDDQILQRYFREALKFTPKINMLSDVDSEELSTTPLTPYAERPYLPFVALNPLREPHNKGDIGDRVYDAHKD